MWSASISALVVILFTLGVGIKAAGKTGLIKMTLIYLTMLASGWLVLDLAGGTASGLALGVATTLKIDALKGWLNNHTRGLLYSRVLTTIVVSLAFVLLLFNLGSAIMDWSFLSMGLRVTTICFSLLLAVFLGAIQFKPQWARSIFVAPT